MTDWALLRATTLWQDVRYAARTLRRQPGLTAAAVVMLTVGIGATTAIFSVVNSVLLNPLPYPHSDALVRIVHTIGGIEQEYFDDAVYLSYADHEGEFADVGVWSPGATATVTGLGEPEEVRALQTVRGVLTTLGVQPAVGRWFSAAEDLPGAADVVIIGHGYWQRRFGGDPAVIGRPITIDARPHQIVGVMPATFRFDGGQDVILPLRIDRGRLIRTFRLLGVARLRPGVTVLQANADATRVLDGWAARFRIRPEGRARWVPSLRSLKEDVVGEIGSTLWVLMATISIVLLMACANVANLLLVRTGAREREFAIRAALGARWTRFARQLLVESLVLATLGGILGIALAYGGVRVLLILGPSGLPRLEEIAPDGSVLAFALGIALASGLLFGLMPILKYARPSSTQTLGRSSVHTTRHRQRAQGALVAAQVALALVLLVSAGLMIRSFQALLHVEPGFVQERVQTFGMSIPDTTVADLERVTRMQHDVLNRIESIAGVESAAFATRLPMGGDRSSAALAVEGRADDGRTPANRQVKIISPGLFQTLGIRLVAGRDVTWTDVYGIREIAVVSENLARELWGSPEAALGKRVREYYDAKSRWCEIVGVVGDVYDDGADQPAPATIYWPAQPLPELLNGYQSRRVSVAIRTGRAGEESFQRELREAVWLVNQDLPLSQVVTLGEMYGESLERTSFTLVMLAVAAAMALLMGLSGLYGVVAYAVSQRRREIGIRMALGARSGDIPRQFVREGMILLAAGVAIGLGAAVAFVRLMESLVFNVTTLDPVTFVAMPLLLAVAAALASYLPSRRAALVDPVETLRAE